MSEPLVTFGLTVFRRPTYLLQSAGSVLSQTYPHIELLIAINPQDTEAPALLECAAHLAALDDRVRTVLCPDCTTGFAKTRHLAEVARGEWWACLDYDDLALPNRLEKQLPLIDKYDVISGQAIYFGMKDGRRVPVPAGDLTPAHFQKHNAVASPTVLVRTELFQRIDAQYQLGPYDYKLWVDLINEGRRFFAIPDVVALHRLEPTSTYNAHMRGDIVSEISKQVKAPPPLARIPLFNKLSAKAWGSVRACRRMRPSS
jgi:teichuronic acid biosynthesis glycosyltransferase TuaG